MGASIFPGYSDLKGSADSVLAIRPVSSYSYGNILTCFKYRRSSLNTVLPSFLKASHRIRSIWSCIALGIKLIGLSNESIGTGLWWGKAPCGHYTVHHLRRRDEDHKPPSRKARACPAMRFPVRTLINPAHHSTSETNRGINMVLTAYVPETSHPVPPQYVRQGSTGLDGHEITLSRAWKADFMWAQAQLFLGWRCWVGEPTIISRSCWSSPNFFSVLGGYTTAKQRLNKPRRVNYAPLLSLVLEKANTIRLPYPFRFPPDDRLPYPVSFRWLPLIKANAVRHPFRSPLMKATLILHLFSLSPHFGRKPRSAIHTAYLPRIPHICVH